MNFPRLIVVIFLLATLSNSWAQESGRLPDGTAYRTTSDGFEVSDYIAELEVANQELHNRLIKVEGELAKIRLREKSSSPIEEQTIDRSDCNECQTKLIEVSELARKQDLLIKDQNQKLQQFQGELKQANFANAQDKDKDQPEIVKPLIPQNASTLPSVNGQGESVKQLFNSLRALQQQRFKMYKEYNEIRDRKGRIDSFKPEELVATSGRDLRVLQIRSKNIKTELEEVSIIRDLNEIRAKLQKDIDKLIALKRSLEKA